MNIVRYVLLRLREPSTWAGIAAGIAAIGWTLPAEQWSAIVQVGLGVAALAATFLPETKA